MPLKLIRDGSEIIRSTLLRIAPQNLLTNQAFESHSAFQSLGRKRLHLVSIGKAALGLAEAASSYLGERIVSGRVFTSQSNTQNQVPARFRIYYGEHPIPGPKSLESGAALIGYLEALPQEDGVIFLVSGGGSSCVERLKDGWSLAEVQRETQNLLESPHSIVDVNQKRSEWSQLKRGGLLRFLNSREWAGFIVSDVSTKVHETVSSGPLFSQNETHRMQVIASPKTVADLTAEESKRLHYQTQIIDSAFDGSVSELADQVIKHYELKGSSGDRVLIWAGETHLKSKLSGYGGRNQHLLLSVIERLGSRTDLESEFSLFSVGTDGGDGSTPNAGGYVIPQNMTERIEIQSALKAFDSGKYLEQRNQVIKTGPTGTNLADLILLLIRR